jgi:hypothetical protein
LTPPAGKDSGSRANEVAVARSSGVRASCSSSTMPVEHRGARIDFPHAEPGSHWSAAPAAGGRALEKCLPPPKSPLPAVDLNGARRNLSKSKLMAFRQCRRRLWLEVHYANLREDSDSAKSSYRAGYLVGETARRVYDPQGRGAVIDLNAEGCTQALARTSALLETPQPIFEAGFAACGGIAFADVLLPVVQEGEPAWRMVEVKSSTSVKTYQRDDVAVQAYVARAAGVRLASVAVAHVDSSWVYPGEGRYEGLLKERDLSGEAFSRRDEVRSWLDEAQSVADQAFEPGVDPGSHCTSPFECGFIAHCSRDRARTEYPVAWLPRVRTKALKAHLAQPGVVDMRDVPDELLDARQLQVKTLTLQERVWFDQAGAAKRLRRHEAPMCFLDFETIQFAVPVWPGTRPYQQLPFQFSVHRLLRDGVLEHDEFLDLSGRDPSRDFVQPLLQACGDHGPIFVYNASFERARMRELGERFARFRAELEALSDRIVDLLPIAREHYYHPSQEGSWSIKKLLPAAVRDLDYANLDGVQDGEAAMAAYLGAIAPATDPERKAVLERQLLAYCRMDTYAMVRLWQVFAGRDDLCL